MAPSRAARGSEAWKLFFLIIYGNSFSATLAAVPMCSPIEKQFCPGQVPCPQCGAPACPCPPALPAALPAPPGPHALPGPHVKAAPTVPAAARRLKVWNRCSEGAIWIAHEAAGGAVGPDPQNVKIAPHQSFDFLTNHGLTGTRFWPKMFCNEKGDHCLLGGSGGPAEACVGRGVLPGGKDDYSKCAPPIDTKFEATYGHVSQAGSLDWIDISLVDGFTLPFKLTTSGGWCHGGDGTSVKELDCSGLSFDSCPAAEQLGPQAHDLRAKHPITGDTMGCYSPCTKLMDPKWNNTAPHGHNRWDPVVAPFCCPTPPMTAETCKQGAISNTKFVGSVHRLCPGVYAFAYDDGTGLLRCSPSTSYELNFYCPSPMPKKTEWIALFGGWFSPELQSNMLLQGTGAVLLVGLLAGVVFAAAGGFYARRRYVRSAGEAYLPVGSAQSSQDVGASLLELPATSA